MKGILVNIVLAISISLIVACGGAKKAVVSQSEISQANSIERLEVLYDKIGKTIIESSGSSKKEAMAVQSQIVSRLVSLSEQNVEKQLSNKTPYDLVSRKDLRDTLSSIQSLKKWDGVAFEKIRKRIVFEQTSTNTAIDKAKKAATENQSILNVKLKLLEKASILAGDGEPESEQFNKTKLVDLEQLSKDGRSAFQKRMFNTAIEKAKMGLLIDEGNIGFEALLAQADAALFKQKFNEALQKGKPEVAYNALIEVADKPIMLQIKKSMGRDILLLANYFANNAQVAYNKGNLFLAYTEFRRGRDIQEKLGSSNKGFIQEKSFLDLLKKQATKNAENHGHNYALLQVIKEFDENYPTLSESLSSESEKIVNRSMTKVAISPFREVTSASSVVATVGRRVASKLEKRIFKELGDEILVITDISKVIVQPFSGPHYQIEGEVLQAAIETNKNQARRSKNVQTGIDKLETEEYIKWKKRSKGEAPVQYTETPVMEDILLSLEHISKLAVVELDYKIISPTSQKVLTTNNLSKEDSYKGTTIQEFQKGLFLQEFVQADLPSDIKIMDELSNSLSIELGNKLTEYLTGIEESFYKASNKSKSKGESLASVELLANAVVINKRKLQALESNNSDENKEAFLALKQKQNNWTISLKKQALEGK